MFNCGMAAISLSSAEIDEIFKTFSGSETDCSADIEAKTLTFSNGKDTKVYPFEASAFDLELVRAGGWVDYADQKY
ncbi:MAG: hypothetical protein IJ992_03075 [Lentisphaeria bacterium]|nr:hypothetical protein [Lentisphaeria bacterium]